MKNKERYMDEILDIVVRGEKLAADNRTGMPFACHKIRSECKKCLFKGYFSPCSKLRKSWLEAEYKPMKYFSDEEKFFVKQVDKIQYLIRGVNGSVLGYSNRPIKNEDWDGDWGKPRWILPMDSWWTDISQLTSLPFESIQLKDDKPTSRNEVLGIYDLDDV